MNSIHAGVLKLGLMVGANSALNQFDVSTPLQGFDSKLGYNGNAFARISIAKFIIQPELGYLNNRVGFTVLENSKTVDANLSLGQLYSSALLGVKLGNIRLAGGPMVLYLANQSSEQLTSLDTYLKQSDNSNKINWGGQANLGVDISKRWSVDAKYYHSFSNTEYNAIINGNTNSFKGNTGMISLSIGFSLFNTN